jgi:hypothetical protein
MIPITKAQRVALKRIFDRRPIWKGGSSVEIVQQHGWVFVRVEDLSEYWREKITNPNIQYVWRNDRYSPIYVESDDIVRDYQLSEQLTYRQFRKTVAHGHDCLMVMWQNMWLGIEKDGYIHS